MMTYKLIVSNGEEECVLKVEGSAVSVHYNTPDIDPTKKFKYGGLDLDEALEVAEPLIKKIELLDAWKEYLYEQEWEY